MRWLAAPDDTWGISGPTFLRLYLVGALAALATALVWRARARAVGPDAPRRAFTPAEAGFLHAGRHLAVLAAIGQLRAADALSASRKRLRTSGNPPAGLDPVADAVFAAAFGWRCAQLIDRPKVAAAIDGLERDLAREGLIIDAGGRARARLGGWLLLAVAAFGLVRIIAGLANGRPVGWITLATIATAAAGLVLLVRLPRRTKAGDRALAALRAQYAYLSPAHLPSWTTYGAAAAGLGVGLFGVSALVVADPAFAAEAAINRSRWYAGGDSSESSSGGGGGSYGGGGGGGGCGGGGCGGGGCGGGGCGGGGCGG